MSADASVSATPSERLAALDHLDPVAGELVGRLLTRAPEGLAAAYLPESGGFAQTVRGHVGEFGLTLHREGSNVRYAAMVALGLAHLPLHVQRDALEGRTAGEVASLATRHALRGDSGSMALAAWADAEVNGHFAESLFLMLGRMATSPAPLATVDTAWLVIAGIAAARLGDTETVVEHGCRRLLAQQGAGGIFPHVVAPGRHPSWRSHVGSFADQVYPVQALARAALHTGEEGLLAAANRTADRLCANQGTAGQWWWHYDVRDGSVVERYPVYSAHQHAMAPMALLDLFEAGGHDHREHLAAGVRWLAEHPEVPEDLVCGRFGLVWRKVGRREPGKAARVVATTATSLRPGVHVPGLDRALPPIRVDHECRPYELAWLLHAWLSTPLAVRDTPRPPALRIAGS